MKTYYGIKKEDVAKGTDWGAISKSYSDIINKEITRRENKKAAIDKQIRQDLKDIQKMPQGQHKGINDGLASLSELMTTQSLADAKLLRNGDMSVKDWTNRRQNRMDDTKRVQDIGTQLQEQYGEIMDGYRDGTLSQINVDEWENYGNMIDFNNHGFYEDPESGKLFLAQRNEDGSIDTSKTNSIETLNNGMRQRYNRFDKNVFLEENVNAIGTFRTFYKDGTIVSDPRIRDKYKAFKNSAIDEVTSNDSKLASLLIDDVAGIRDEDNLIMPGKEYRITKDREEFENDKTGLLILGEFEPNNSGILNFTFQDSQKEAARTYLDTQFEMAVGSDKSPGTKKKNNQKGGGKGMSGDDIIKNINMLTAGGDQANLAESALRENYNQSVETDKSFRAPIQKISTSAEGYTITFKSRDGLTDKFVPVDENATQQQRVATLYEFLQPSQSKEDSFSNVFTNQQIVEVPQGGLGTYEGTVLRTRINPIGLDAKSSLDETFEDRIDRAESQVENQQPGYLLDLFNDMLDKNGADKDLVNLKVEMDGDKVTVSAGNEEVSSFDWKSGFFSKKRNPSDIKTQIRAAYKDIAEKHNQLIPTKRTTTSGAGGGDAPQGLKYDSLIKTSSPASTPSVDENQEEVEINESEQISSLADSIVDVGSAAQNIIKQYPELYYEPRTEIRDASLRKDLYGATDFEEITGLDIRTDEGKNAFAEYKETFNSVKRQLGQKDIKLNKKQPKTYESIDVAFEELNIPSNILTLYKEKPRVIIKSSPGQALELQTYGDPRVGEPGFRKFKRLLEGTSLFPEGEGEEQDNAIEALLREFRANDRLVKKAIKNFNKSKKK